MILNDFHAGPFYKTMPQDKVKIIFLIKLTKANCNTVFEVLVGLWLYGLLLFQYNLYRCYVSSWPHIEAWCGKTKSQESFADFLQWTPHLLFLKLCNMAQGLFYHKPSLYNMENLQYK